MLGPNFLVSLSKNGFLHFPHKIQLLSKKDKILEFFIGKITYHNIHKKTTVHIRHYYGLFAFSSGFPVIAALKFENG